MREDAQYVLCPYCGHTQRKADRCEECHGLFEPLSRKATQIAMGPWYIRDKARPFRPGCSYEVLKRQIQAGKLKPTTVLRGPTTKQFWSVARNAPGVAHLLGFCHGCGAQVPPHASKCPACGAAFEEPGQRNELGLQYASAEAASAAQRSLERQIAEATGTATEAADTGRSSAANESKTPAALPGADLLDQVLGTTGRSGRRGAAGHPARPAPSVPGSPTVTRPAAPPPAPVATPQALDFAPSEGPEGGSEDQIVVASGRPSALTIWLLVVSNIIVLALVVLVVLTMLKQPPS